MTRIDDIKERLRRASPGPWKLQGETLTALCASDAENPTQSQRRIRVCELPYSPMTGDDNAPLLLWARADIEWCLAEIERLKRVAEAQWKAKMQARKEMLQA